MSPPIAEIKGTNKQIHLNGDIDVGHEDNETLLIPDMQQSGKALENIIKAHPDAVVTITPDIHGRVSVEGEIVPNVEIDTSESRVIGFK